MEYSQTKRIQKFLPSTPPTTPTCKNCSCFFCIMSETNPSIKRTKMAHYLRKMPLIDDEQGHILAISCLWKIAMTKPNDPEFPRLGIFKCMAKLIHKGLTNKDWLFKFQNIYIPYYAAHIIGSYTMNKPKFAEIAVKSNVVKPLIQLLRGKMSWVEQRVSVRALGHLASHEVTFEAVAEHEEEIIETAMKIASTCLYEVYEYEREEYHRNLLTRGLGGIELEERKTEEWTIQLQCWSIYLIDCFARKQRCLRLICNKREFLKDLSTMWGGLVNPTSPSGIGLLRTLCYTKIGRQRIADVKEVTENLCNVARSSDSRQYIAIDGLLQILKDPISRYKVIDTVAPILADLVESKKAGQEITHALLQDYHKLKFCEMKLKNEKTEEVLMEVWEIKVEKVKRESLMSEREVRERERLACVAKQEGNEKYKNGEIEEAVKKYTKGLKLCPLKARRERIVMYSNRAQCYLVMREAERAIEDATRALSLCHVARPHGKSLWRRSQGYEMKEMAKESLMDCMRFMESRIVVRRKRKKRLRIPYYAVRMANKQMNATWIFAKRKRKTTSGKKEEILKDEKEEVEEFKGHYQMDTKARKKRTRGRKERRYEKKVRKAGDKITDKEV